MQSEGALYKHTAAPAVRLYQRLENGRENHNADPLPRVRETVRQGVASVEVLTNHDRCRDVRQRATKTCMKNQVLNGETLPSQQNSAFS